MGLDSKCEDCLIDVIRKINPGDGDIVMVDINSDISNQFINTLVKQLEEFNDKLGKEILYAINTPEDKFKFLDEEKAKEFGWKRTEG